MFHEFFISLLSSHMFDVMNRLPIFLQYKIIENFPSIYIVVSFSSTCMSSFISTLTVYYMKSNHAANSFSRYLLSYTFIFKADQLYFLQTTRTQLSHVLCHFMTLFTSVPNVLSFISICVVTKIIIKVHIFSINFSIY